MPKLLLVTTLQESLQNTTNKPLDCTVTHFPHLRPDIPEQKVIQKCSASTSTIQLNYILLYTSHTNPRPLFGSCSCSGHGKLPGYLWAHLEAHKRNAWQHKLNIEVATYLFFVRRKEKQSDNFHAQLNNKRTAQNLCRVVVDEWWPHMSCGHG